MLSEVYDTYEGISQSMKLKEIGLKTLKPFPPINSDNIDIYK